MDIIKKTFDLKKCARALGRHPGEPEREVDLNSGLLTPEALTSAMYRVYIHVLRHNTINIRELDFSKIDEDDIDDLENILENSSANSLFRLSEFFIQFKPACTDKRAFI